MITGADEPSYNYFKIGRLKPFDRETSIRSLDEGLKGKCRELYGEDYEITGEPPRG